VPLGRNHARPRCTVRRSPRPRGAQPSSATALLGESTAAWHRRTRDGGERRLTGAETAARRDGDGQAASGARRSGWHGDGLGGTASDCGSVGTTTRRARQSGRRRRARGSRETGCWDARRAVPTVALCHGLGAARGSHVAMARCRTGPARRAASDRWGPLVNDFRIKNHPKRK
jgi:hypothetical protein